MPHAALICLVTEDVQEDESFKCGSRPEAVQLIASLTLLWPFQKCRHMSIYFEGRRKHEYGQMSGLRIKTRCRDISFRNRKPNPCTYVLCGLDYKEPGYRRYVLDGSRFKFRHWQKCFSSRKLPYMLRGSSTPPPSLFPIASVDLSCSCKAVEA